MEGLETFGKETTEGGESAEENGDCRHCFAEGLKTEAPSVDFVEETEEEDCKDREENLVRNGHGEVLSEVDGSPMQLET